MAKLINGNGNLAIYAEEDADWFGSIFGNQTAITQVGNQFAYSLLDANTVGIEDGVIITKEGRRVQLNANEIDEFDIPTGAQGTTNYYIIGYHLITDETSAQTCETFVELMDNGTDTIPEDTFRGGADEVFISLYRVKQVDLTITELTLLLPKVSTISEINTDLTELNNLIIDARKLFNQTLTEATIVTLPHTVTEDIQAFNLSVQYGGASAYSGGAITIDDLDEIAFTAIPANSPQLVSDKTVILKKGQIINGSVIGSGLIAVRKLAHKE